jgi:hypothetical protein
MIRATYRPAYYEDDYHDSSMCRHGNLFKYGCDECDSEDDTDIDKCLNCGRYRASSALNEHQCCKKGCTNPNEY